MSLDTMVTMHNCTLTCNHTDNNQSLITEITWTKIMIRKSIKTREIYEQKEIIMKEGSKKSVQHSKTLP